MGRLSQPAPRLAAATRRLSESKAQDTGPTQAIRDAAPYRAWYKTKAWRDLRQSILVRDAYTCQRTGALCSGKHPEPNSPVVNHIRPHRGNEKRFWDPNNLETVTKAVHDSLIQKEEQESLHHRGVWD